jgi:glycosyltransferase involved in cell wall biosynthesis
MVKNNSEETGEARLGEEELALTILKMTSDQAFSERISAAAYENPERFDLKITVSHYLNIYNEIIAD